MMKDYKDTLNLPTTDFPMKANLANREPDMLKRWYDMDLYHEMRSRREGAEKFILHDGPPYANGHLHLGHAVNKILKDIIVKSKFMSGLDAPYVPGWDCHGLPIELNVEKKIGKAGVKVGHDEFRQACREYAQSQIDIQREEFKRLGVIGDWENPYLTMDFKFEANIIRSLGKIINNGHFVRGSKPVHWCMDCESALAEAEVEYKDKTSPAVDVRFTVLDDEALLARMEHSGDHKGEGEINIPIWTTTPWTLPANQAVSLHPKINYALLQCESDHHKERILVAESLLVNVVERFGIENHRVIAYCEGEALEGLKLQHPFYNREVPIVLGDHVTVESGTGAVHTAPGHGQEDYIIGMQYKLPIDNPVGDNGCFVEGTELFEGLHVLKVNESVVEVLKAKGKLLHHEAYEHSYPHCWRHKSPVIFRATPQWFISMDKEGLREKAEKAIPGVKWIPGWGEARIVSMIENRPDWCVSRQRTWGVPIPLFVNKVTNELHPETPRLLEEVALMVEEGGIEKWFALHSSEILGADAEDYAKLSDTLDVWFDSGVTHACVLDDREELSSPADLYLEGSDQHRGWFQSSLLSSIAIHGRAPYKQVLTHGFTVDEQGRKMSKSLGNVVAPEKVMNSLGADILRLWVASTDYRGEIAASDEILKRTSDTYRRIRNTARFLLSNLSGFEFEQHAVSTDDMLALDRWAIDCAAKLQGELKDAYDEYQFHLIFQKIHHFCAIDMGGFYLDIIKDRQYTMQKESLARRSAQTAMYHIIEALVRWLAPILSFTADEIWQHMPGKRSETVFFETWYQDLFELGTSTSLNREFWDQIIAIRDVVNKQVEEKRASGDVGSSLEANVSLYCSPEIFECLSKLEDELRFVLITSSADLLALDQKPDTAVETEVAGLWVNIESSDANKCLRCWHRRADIGIDKEHADICARCVQNVAGEGEERKFA